MPVTITFQGLCGLVSGAATVEASSTLDVLLIDAAGAGLECVHAQKLEMRAADLEDPDGLTIAGSNAALRVLQLAGKSLTVSPIGLRSSQAGFRGQNLSLIPSMERVCGIGTVHAGCFSTPPTQPIAARIQLPSGGTLSGDLLSRTPAEWSFAPSVGSCYHDRFSKMAHFELPAADHLLIKIEALDGKQLGTLTVHSSSARITVSNLCTEVADDTPSDDTLVFLAILDPPFVGDPPKSRPNATCDMPVTESPGIGCVPFLLSRSSNGG